jgi:transcriptional regulator with XRE-family HTH domain
MPRRAIPADPSIGERIRARRELRRWSQRHAADRAGMSHTSWQRIEAGTQRTDRYMIADIAAALECSVADLTGRPHVPGDRHLETAHARINRLWRALVDTAPDEPEARSARPVEVLRERTELVEDRCWRMCDYAAVGELLPDLLVDLHAARPAGREVAALMVRATYVATATFRNLGYIAEATLAAERCRHAAEDLEDPGALAVADYTRAYVAMASGAWRRAQTLTTRASDELGQHLAAPAASETLGMLHLSSALSVLAERRMEDAREHLAEARSLAERTGETKSWCNWFGPTNVGIWTVAIEVAGGDPGKAVETARSVNPASLLSRGRQANFHLDCARGLADLRRDREAVRSLLTAEKVAPQLIRSSVAARETSRWLLNRARRQAGGTELRGLCERLGVAA